MKARKPNADPFSAARMRALAEKPYLARGLCRVRPVERKGLRTAGIDRSWKVYYDPEVWASWDPDAAAAILEHEVWHPLRMHPERLERPEFEAYSHQEKNLAADAEIHHDSGLVARLPPTPPGAHYSLPADYEAEEGALAESMLRSRQPAPTITIKITCDGGSGATGVTAEWEEPDDGSGPDPAEVEAIARAIAEDARRQARERGDVPAHVLRWADGILAPPTVPWRRMLAATVKQACWRAISGREDYSYARPRKRPAAVVLPGTFRPVPEVAVIVDTSGSMSAEDLAAAVGEVVGICRACGTVRVVACDAAAQKAQLVASARSLRLTGGGGTDMRVAFTELEKARPHPHVIVCISDCETEWPAAAPKARVIVAKVGGGPAPAPDWARVVEVGA